jgi:hypothetical protein
MSLPPVRTSLANVFIVNSAQIANGTLNVNETIGLANAQALRLVRYFDVPTDAQASPAPPLAAARAG